MTLRNKRRQRQRQETHGYKALFESLCPRDQRIVNEKIIWAVNQLTDLDGMGPKGTKSFIEARGKQLILDWQRQSWAMASKRFRNAISKRASKASNDTLGKKASMNLGAIQMTLGDVLK